MNGTTKVQFRHYIEHDGPKAWIVTDGMVTSLLIDRDLVEAQAQSLMAQDKTNGIPVRCEYKGRVFMFMPALHSGTTYLLNQNGKILSGSNIYDSSFSRPGSLCLGTSINPLNTSALEAMMFNAANADLYWYGEPIHGEWVVENGRKTFHIKIWPGYSQHQQIPQGILDDTAAW